MQILTGEQIKRESKEKEREMRRIQRNDRRQREEQDKTRQLAATSVETLNRKHPTASVGKPGEESSEASQHTHPPKPSVCDM